MRFKIDENLPKELAEILHSNGHDAETVAQEGLKGTPDSRLGEVCREENRSLITLDLGFADIRAHPPDQYPGLLVLRGRSQDKETVLAAFRRAIPQLEKEQVNQRLWIIERDRIRIWSGK